MFLAFFEKSAKYHLEKKRILETQSGLQKLKAKIEKKRQLGTLVFFCKEEEKKTPEDVADLTGI